MGLDVNVVLLSHATNSDLMSILIILRIVFASGYHAADVEPEIYTILAQNPVPRCISVEVFSKRHFDNATKRTPDVLPDRSNHANVLALDLSSGQLLKVDLAAVFTQTVLAGSVMAVWVSQVQESARVAISLYNTEQAPLRIHVSKVEPEVSIA